MIKQNQGEVKMQKNKENKKKISTYQTQYKNIKG